MYNNKDFALNKDDFTLLGETEAVDKESGFNLVNKSGAGYFWWTYSIGDDITTYRGITIGSTKEEVFEKYGSIILLSFDAKNDFLLYSTLMLHQDELEKEGSDKKAAIGDFKNIKGNEKWAEYSYFNDTFQRVYFIRFYFDENDKVVLMGFYNLSTEMAEEKMLDDFYQRNIESYGPECHLVYDIQYKLLPQILFTDIENTIKAINDKSNFVYELIKESYKMKLKKKCPYTVEDIEVTNKVMFVDNDTFNLTKIKFNVDIQWVLSKIIFIAYDNKFQNARYFTVEHDEFGTDENVIHFCEVFKDGRQNYGKRDYNEAALEKEIIDMFTDKIVTTGIVTKYPKAKAKNKEINVNDKVWLGIRVLEIKDWKKYEPESKIKKVEGIMIFGLEVGSPFKECNLSFYTANFLTKFDGVKVTKAKTFAKVLEKYKPKDKVIVTIDSYDSDLDKFLSREYKVVLSSKNDETYELVYDNDTYTSKMGSYLAINQKEQEEK